MSSIKELYDQCDGILLLSGAGMSVDSGLPDFRGKTGMWSSDKEAFYRFATANAFKKELKATWGYYINRHLAYTTTKPHAGYDLIKELNKDTFFVTSNVDQHFRYSGYAEENILEIHGSYKLVQCVERCDTELYSFPKFDMTLKNNGELVGDPPTCPKCGAYIRPNIMMFDDPNFNFRYVDYQFENFAKWRENKKFILGIEIGAGLTIPSIRLMSMDYTQALIRINVYDFDVSREQDISISDTAANGLTQILNEIK